MTRKGLLVLACAGLAGAALGCEAQSAPQGPGSLEGLWTGASYTELERPDELKTLVLTPKEALDWEQKLRPSGGVNTGPDPLGQAASEFPESGSGLARVRGEIRSSVIIEPADGKLPLTTVAKAALGIEPRRRRGYDNVEARPQDERCLSSDTGGAASIPTADANVLQIIETPGHVAIFSERYHDARVIPLTQVRDPRWPSSWLGDSVAHWEGATLVVETSNYRPGLTQRSGTFQVTPQSRIIERFTRLGAARIHYAFSVTDPSMYMQTWRGEYEFAPSGPIFEYACHEGNYGIVNILGAAKLGLQDPPPSVKTAP